MKTERYLVKLLGPSTNNEWVVIAQRVTKKSAETVYQEWVATHGYDHYVILEDSKKGESMVSKSN